MTNVIVTALPHSGVSEIVYVIESLPNSVCLRNPPSHNELAREATTASSFAKLLVSEFATTRKRLLAKKPVPDFFTSAELSGEFILGAKHPTLYTSALPEIAALSHFKIIAMIRHPLDVFSSWQRLNKPIITPEKPAGIARFWPETLSIMSSAPNHFAQFVQLYDLFLGRYHLLRKHVHILKYEDMMADSALVGKILGVKGEETLKHVFIPRAYEASDAEQLRDAIRRYGVFTKLYYNDI